MKVCESPYPAGTVGFICGSTPRYYDFHDSLEALHVPKGTTLTRSFSCNPARNTNGLIAEMDGAWLWHQGDDHSFAPDTLMRLLAYDVDVIVPLVPRVAFPFKSVVWKQFDPGPPASGKPYEWDEIDACRRKGVKLLPVAAAGTAGLLAKKHVYDAMREAYGEPIFRVGLVAKDELSEDVEFTWKCNQLGFQVYAALDVFMGHMVGTSIEPHVTTDGRLAIGPSIRGTFLGGYVTKPDGTIAA